MEMDDGSGHAKGDLGLAGGLHAAMMARSVYWAAVAVLLVKKWAAK